MATTILPIAPPPVRPARIRLSKIFLRSDPTPVAATHAAELHFVEMGALHKTLLWLLGKLGAHTLWCPVAIRGQKPDALPALSVIGRTMGFGDDHSQRLLDHHDERRLLRWRASAASLDFLLQPLLLLFLTGPWLTLIPSASSSRSLAVEIATWILFLLVELVLMAMLAMMFRRLTELLLDRHFAEAICATQTLYLLVELRREDVLARTDRRRDLVARLDELARAARLLGLQYGAGQPATRSRVQRHFREIARYVEERRVWAITPMETTLQDLTRDLRELAHIFITGTYGELGWGPEEVDHATSGWRSAVRTAGRAVALVAPFAGIAYLLPRPEVIQSLGGTGNVVLLVMIAWALLSVDAVLRLGLVSGVVSLAKSIKELK